MYGYFRDKEILEKNKILQLKKIFSTGGTGL